MILEFIKFFRGQTDFPLIYVPHERLLLLPLLFFVVVVAHAAATASVASQLMGGLELAKTFLALNPVAKVTSSIVVGGGAVVASIVRGTIYHWATT